MKPRNVRSWRRQPLARGGPPCVLGDELSADPFQLFATGIAKLERAAVEASAELDRNAEARFDIGGDRAQVGGRGAKPPATRSVRPHPVLRLPDRPMPPIRRASRRGRGEI